MRAAALLGCAILLAATAPRGAGAEETPQAPLSAEAPVTLALTGEGPRALRLSLAAGDYVQVTAEPAGVDVRLRVRGPHGEELLAVDDLTCLTGREVALWTSAAAGDFHLEVERAGAGGEGTVQVRLTARRPAVAGDQGLADAERLLGEGRRLLAAAGEQPAPEARAALDRARVGFAAAGDRRKEALARIALARADLALGDLAAAVAGGETAAELAAGLGEASLQAAVFGSLAELVFFQGRYDHSLAIAEQSLLAWRAAGDRYGEAEALSNMGVMYAHLGEHPRALAHLEPALAIWRDLGHLVNAAVTSANVGSTLQRAGELERAMGPLRTAFDLHRELGNLDGEAYAAINLGETLWRAGKLEPALDLARQARAAARAAGVRRVEGASHILEGVIQMGRGELAAAREEVLAGLAMHGGEPWFEATSLLFLARVERARGELDTARRHAEEGLRILEAMRATIGAANLRASFLGGEREHYELPVDIQMRLHQREPGRGHDRLAWQAAQRGRARSLLDLLAESRADLRAGVDPELLAQEEALRQRLGAREERRLRRDQAAGESASAGADADAIEETRRELERLATRIQQHSPRFAELTQLVPISLAEVQGLLGEDTLLLELALGADASYLFAVTAAELQVYPLPPRRELEELARRAHAELASPGGGDATGTKALGRLLLAPVAALLRGRRLAVVADGALHYVPFGALPDPDGGEPLLARHEVIGLPAAGALAVLRGSHREPRPARRTLAVFADPVFSPDDERLAGARVGERSAPLPPPATGAAALSRAAEAFGTGGTLPRLPFTRREARSLADLVEPGDALLALDFEASRSRLLAADLAEFRFVHFATHGWLDGVHPELSGIVLSLVDPEGRPQRGFLTAAEAFSLHLDADLVVLSGCRTGLGREVRGEGMLGLTRGLLYAGAERVVASLWKVDDAATAALMTAFYREMLGPAKRPPAAALRAAQLALRGEERYRHPFYWAAFQLQGDWR